MACKPICKLCDKLIISTAVNFDAAANALLINLPAGDYQDGCKYCIVVAQTIPDTTTRSAQVFFTIGTGTVRYPVTKRNCAPLTACGIQERTKYSTCVDTSSTSGVFRLLGNPCYNACTSLRSINGTAPAAAAPATPATT